MRELQQDNSVYNSDKFEIRDLILHFRRARQTLVSHSSGTLRRKDAKCVDNEGNRDNSRK